MWDHHKMGIQLAMIVLCLAISACYRVAQYSGDGYLVDNGSSAATDRYILNLGKIDLTKSGTSTCRLDNLPSVDFVVGIQIDVKAENQSVIENRMVNPIVSFELQGAGGEILFNEKGNLKDWTWSVPRVGNKAFVYRVGKPSSFFLARSRTPYKLVVAVVEPDSSQSEYSAMIIAKSGGWK